MSMLSWQRPGRRPKRRSRINDAQVRVIRKAFSHGVKTRDIAAFYNEKQPLISAIAHYRNRCTDGTSQPLSLILKRGT